MKIHNCILGMLISYFLLSHYSQLLGAVTTSIFFLSLIFFILRRLKEIKSSSFDTSKSHWTDGDF